jgi:2-isopropylmalate synthase
VNSQSDKGGVAFLLERDHGLRLPRNLQIEFSRAIQRISEASGGEITSRAIWERFAAEYLERRDPIELLSYRTCEAPADRETPSDQARARSRNREQIPEQGQAPNHGEASNRGAVPNQDGALDQVGRQVVEFRILFEGNEKWIRGLGNGPIDAFVDALDRGIGQPLQIVDFSEHAVREGADAGAVAYVEIDAGRGRTLFGVGRHANSTTACLTAVVAAANRLLANRGISTT